MDVQCVRRTNGIGRLGICASGLRRQHEDLVDAVTLPSQHLEDAVLFHQVPHPVFTFMRDVYELLQHEAGERLIIGTSTALGSRTTGRDFGQHWGRILAETEPERGLDGISANARGAGLRDQDAAFRRKDV